MRPRSRGTEQDDLLRPRLTDLIDMRHALIRLEALIDWDVFEAERAGSFPSRTGRAATSPRLVAGLLYLQHAYALSDEAVVAVVARWAEPPCWQHFCGETLFQHRPPIDPSSLTRWRKRIGEGGVEWLLTETIEARGEAGVIDMRSTVDAIVDTTVMERRGPWPRWGRASPGAPSRIPPTRGSTRRPGRVWRRWRRRRCSRCARAPRAWARASPCRRAAMLMRDSSSG
jgi:IS5 family transposase